MFNGISVIMNWVIPIKISNLYEARRRTSLQMFLLSIHGVKFSLLDGRFSEDASHFFFTLGIAAKRNF